MERKKARKRQRISSILTFDHDPPLSLTIQLDYRGRGALTSTNELLEENGNNKYMYSVERCRADF
jgi:hypothetical protein